MKTLKFPYLVIVLILITACSSDNDSSPLGDDSTAAMEALIVGDWKLTISSAAGNVTADNNNVDWSWYFYYPIPITSTTIIETQQNSVNFSRTNQITSNGSLDISYIAQVIGYENSYNYPEVVENIDVFKEGNWSVNDLFLTVNSQGVSEIFPIIEFTKNEFTILKHVKDGISIDNLYDNEIIPCTANLELMLTFKRN